MKFEPIKPFLESLKKPYILTGDFNSLSDEDRTAGWGYDEAKMLEILKEIGIKEPEKSVKAAINPCIDDDSA